MLFKANGRAPTSKLNFWFLMYSVYFSLELLMTMVFILHIMNPISNVFGFGFPFLFVLPGLTIIAPIWGLLAILIGSATMLKSYSNMNATLVVMNYPLTALYLLYSKDNKVYITIIVFLILNKIPISFFGAKVRQHFVNPCFAKNQIKMQETLSDMMTLEASAHI